MPIAGHEPKPHTGYKLGQGKRKKYDERKKLVVYMDIKERERLYAFCDGRALNPSQLMRLLALNYVAKNGG